MAVALDDDRAVLGVPGMNYSHAAHAQRGLRHRPATRAASTCRSTRFMYRRTRTSSSARCIFSLIQMLWDRAEANGYAHHMTDDPLPNTPPHEVMLHAGLGDHQVARSRPRWRRARSGRAQHAVRRSGPRHRCRPALRDPADPELPVRRLRDRAVGHRAAARRDGETVGTKPPPTANTAARRAAGQDPHEIPRRTPHARPAEVGVPAIGGQVIDVCGAPVLRRQLDRAVARGQTEVDRDGETLSRPAVCPDLRSRAGRGRDSRLLLRGELRDR